MKVQALDMGFFGGARRRPGDTFEVPDGTKAKWFTPVAEVKAPKAPPKPVPVALSQLGKEPPKGPTDLA